MKRRLGILGIVLAATMGLWFFCLSPLLNEWGQPAKNDNVSARTSLPSWPASWPTHSSANMGGHAVPALEWLDETIEQLRVIPPFIAKTRMDIHLFDEALQVDGRYLQSRAESDDRFSGNSLSASGSRELYRWDFEFASLPEPIRTSQMFDGRYFYALHISSGERLLEYADLYDVPKIADKQQGKLAPPSAWNGTGGLIKVLQHLRNSFHFHSCESVPAKSPTGMPFQVIRGQWKVETLKQLLREQVAPQYLEPEVIWDRLPRQLPHAVEIWIGSDEHLSRFPYRLLFYQYVEAGEGQWKPQLMFATTLYELKFPGEIPVSEFQVDTSGAQPIELTKDYYDRIRMYLSYPVE